MRETLDPLDIDSLTKGSIIPASALEEETGYDREHRDYNLKILDVSDFIRRVLKRRGLLVTIVQRGPNLHILTDEEASPLLQTDTTRYLS